MILEVSMAFVDHAKIIFGIDRYVVSDLPFIFIRQLTKLMICFVLVLTLADDSVIQRGKSF